MNTKARQPAYKAITTQEDCSDDSGVFELKLPVYGHTPLINRFITDARKRTLETIILYQEITQQQKIEMFYSDIHAAVFQNYIKRAAELALSTQPDNRVETNLESIRTDAVQYIYQLYNPCYRESMCLGMVDQIYHTIRYGDWLTTKGIREIDKHIRIILGLQSDYALR